MHEALCKILNILPGCQWRGKSAEHLMEGDPAKLHSLVQGYINLFTHVCNQFHNKEDITHNTYVACMSKDAIWVWCHVKFHSHLTNQISVIELWAARGAWRPCLQLLQLPCPFQCLWQTTILTRVQLVCIHLLNAHTQTCKILRTLNSNMCKTYATLTCSHLLPNILALSITDRLQAWNHIRRKWMKDTWWVHSSRISKRMNPLQAQKKKGDVLSQ
jgi:hypothetical protein